MTLRLASLWLIAGLACAVETHAQVVPAKPTDAPAKHMPPVTPPPTAKPKDDGMVDSFKLADGDIDSVLSALETFTGCSIVRPGTLPTATYTLKINRPIPKAELVTALETLLALNGISTTPMGSRFIEVTALSQAKSQAPEMISGSSLDLPPSGRIVTKLFELNFLRVSEFVPQIQTFMTPGIGGGIVQLEKANVAMVTDTLQNIQKIERLINEVDRPKTAGLKPKFYSLHNGAKASDVVQKIHSMLSGPSGTLLRATTSYTPDDRTNQIILIADPREYTLFDSLIAQLDIVADPTTQNEVIPLKHADSKDVATLLSQLISGQNAATQKSSSVRPGTIATPTTTGAAGGKEAPAAPAAAAPVATAGTEGPLGTTEFSTLVNVQPDPRTNSIVVSGTVDDIKIIKSIIKKIDVLLAQVRIEVVIAEVVLSNTSNSGLSTATVTVGTAPNGGTSITNLTATLAGLGIGPTALQTATATAGTAVNGINPVNLLATLSNLGDISTSKILQQSTIVTTHNKEAMITVTDQLPVITGSTAEPLATGTVSTSFAQSSTVTYKDIGITLKVTPLIGDDGSIQLKVDQTVDDQGPSVIIDGNSQPSINHREATSFINVMNDELVVLGGFQSTTHSLDRQKLGILFEIPIISNLLGYRDNELKRSELLLFLRPHIIPPSEGTADTHKAINGMSNKAQLDAFLKDPTTLPDAKMTFKEHVQ